MTAREEPGTARWRGAGLKVALLALAGLAVAWVLFGADLSPKVENDFFFASDDPELRTSAQIAELFPSGSQIFVRVAGETGEASYAEEVGRLTEAAQAVPGVASVQSLTEGPSFPQAAFRSPFWSRLLAPGDGATYLIVSLEEGIEEGAAVRGLEAAAATSELPVAMSGVPAVVELIRRALLRDLRVFSLAAIVAFGLFIALLFRSGWVVVGMLATCLVACALTLGILTLAGVPIGILTANLVTIVFVLTLSHTIFLTSNRRRLAARGEGLDAAVRITLQASFWCMVTTLLGFLSLLFASAKPLRELGVAGAVGTVVAILAAFLFYPPFLRGLAGEGAGAVGAEPGTRLPGWGPALVVAGVCLLAGLGLGRLDLDPSLLSYFKEGTPLRDDLEAIDRDGGSSPLSLVVRDAAGARLDDEVGEARLRRLHEALEADPAVGTALSAVPLLDEGRGTPFTAGAPASTLLDLLSGPAFQGVALNFVTPDRTRGRYFLRMRESARDEERGEVVARLEAMARDAELEPELAGGLYELQGKIASLVGRSLATGLGGLLLLFVPIAAWVSRSGRSTGSMLLSLILVPCFVLGCMGLFGLPLDIISSPAANVAIALGVDSMIHLATAARRARRAGHDLAASWSHALAALGRPVRGAALLVAGGFGLFALSSFPPSQRFGLAVVLGTLAAAMVSLVLLPALAGRPGRDPSPAAGAPPAT